MTNLVAVLVDDKIYPQIETDLKRYTTQYIQKKYENNDNMSLQRLQLDFRRHKTVTH